MMANRETVEPGVRPRIAPGSRDEIGVVNFLIARAIGLAAGGGPPNLFTTLARHRKLFRAWLRFAGALMPRGQLARIDTELLILRVAHNCDCGYERAHHERLALESGLSALDVAAVFNESEEYAWSEPQRLLLMASDELHTGGSISAQTWDKLREHYSDVELIELCMLVGHYEMLAMTIKSIGIQPDRLVHQPLPPLVAPVVARFKRMAESGRNR